jgi:nitrite reductase (NADH) small subunit
METTTSTAPADSSPATWVPVLDSNRLLPEQGRCVLVNGKQIALFRITADEMTEIFALSNIDPFTGSPVLSRGIIGSVNDEPKVTSPLLKQSFSLRTGVCFDESTIKVDTYSVREQHGMVEISV